MTHFHADIRSVLLDVEKFLSVTTEDIHWKPGQEKEKTVILQKIDTLRQQYSALDLDSSSKENLQNGTPKNGEYVVGVKAKGAKQGQTPPPIDTDVYDEAESPTTPSPNKTPGIYKKRKFSFGRSTENPSDDNYPIVAVADLRDPAKQGFLLKKRKPGPMKVFGAQKRWCVVRQTFMYYYEKSTDCRQKGTISLTGYEARPTPEPISGKKEDFAFEIVCPGKRTYQFVASSEDDMNLWIDIINTESGYNSDIYEPVTENKQEESIKPKSTRIAKDQQPESAIYDDNVTTIIQEDVYEDTDLVYDDTGNTSGSSGVKPQIDTKEPEIVEEIYEDTECPNEEIYDDTEQISPVKPAEEEVFEEEYDDIEALRRDSKGRLFSSEVKSLMPPLGLSVTPPIKSGLNSSKVQALVNELQTSSHEVGNKLEINEQEKLYFTLWDYKAKRGDELSFKRGEVICILNKSNDPKSWWVGKLNGKTGFIPGNYLTPAYEKVS